MGYNVCKEKGSKTYYVSFEKMENGKRLKRRIKKSEWASLGFDGCQSVEELKERAKALNREEAIMREERKRNAAQKRLDWENEVGETLLPTAFKIEFEASLRERRIRKDHWISVKRAILTIKIPPKEWFDKRTRFYDWFADQHYSLDYVNTLRRALNCWGDYYTDKLNQRFKPIPPPNGSDRNKIIREYEKHGRRPGERRRGRPSGRLSFTHLERIKDRFTTTEYNWLFISIAFGLRPEEIEVSLKTVGKWARSKTGEYIKVYQPKLERFESNWMRRWKKIAVKTDEQKRALEMIKSGEFKKPSVQHLRREVDGRGRPITFYGGRKEFYPTMSKLFGKASVQDWMGHMSGETGRKHYDDVEENAPDTSEDDVAA